MKTHPIFSSAAFVNKRMKDLFVAQAEKPEELAEVNLTRLTPRQRALLVTDGTVTRFIEAYTFSPVEVVLLHREKRTLPTEHGWLELPAGGQVIARQVVLQTSPKDNETPTIHTYAVSLIVPQRLPKLILDGLEVEGEGLGMLLASSGLETRRDLLWWGVERAIGLPDAINHLEGKPLLSRTYRIIANKQPIVLINEKFPFDESANLSK